MGVGPLRVGGNRVDEILVSGCGLVVSFHREGKCDRASWKRSVVLGFPIIAFPGREQGIQRRSNKGGHLVALDDHRFKQVSSKIEPGGTLEMGGFRYSAGRVPDGIFSFEVFPNSIHPDSRGVTLEVGKYHEFCHVSSHEVRMASESPARPDRGDIVIISPLDSEYSPPVFSALPHIIRFQLSVTNACLLYTSDAADE